MRSSKPGPEGLRFSRFAETGHEDLHDLLRARLERLLDRLHGLAVHGVLTEVRTEEADGARSVFGDAVFEHCQSKVRAVSHSVNLNKQEQRE